MRNRADIECFGHDPYLAIEVATLDATAFRRSMHSPAR
jgi:hypothetical protein